MYVKLTRINQRPPEQHPQRTPSLTLQQQIPNHLHITHERIQMFRCIQIVTNTVRLSIQPAQGGPVQRVAVYLQHIARGGTIQ